MDDKSTLVKLDLLSNLCILSLYVLDHLGDNWALPYSLCGGGRGSTSNLKSILLVRDVFFKSGMLSTSSNW